MRNVGKHDYKNDGKGETSRCIHPEGQGCGQVRERMETVRGMKRTGMEADGNREGHGRGLAWEPMETVRGPAADWHGTQWER